MPPVFLPPMPLQAGVGKLTSARRAAQRRYDRTAAPTYARTFWNLHCSDGYIAVSKKGTAPYREVDPGLEFKIPSTEKDKDGQKFLPEEGTDLRGDRIPWGILDDCSHFTSCCIGRPFDALRLRPMLKKNPGLKRDDAPRLPAGGLNVPTLESLGTPWIYGIVGAPALMSYLSRPRVGVVLAERLLDGDPTLDAALAKLEAGDAIGITPPEAKGVRRNFGHVVLYDGEGRVLCHTKCRKTARWNIAPEGARYTLVHILDEIDDRP